MNTAVLERLDLDNALHVALERSEFVLHYQPRVECHSGEISGAEALLRWNTHLAVLSHRTRSSSCSKNRG